MPVVVTLILLGFKLPFDGKSKSILQLPQNPNIYIMKNGVGGGGDGMCDVELRTVTTDEPLTRALAKEAGIEDVAVTTESGLTVTVGVRGDRSKPAVVTYHDIGLNAASNFQAGFIFGHFFGGFWDFAPCFGNVTRRSQIFMATRRFFKCWRECHFNGSFPRKKVLLTF